MSNFDLDTEISNIVGSRENEFNLPIGDQENFNNNPMTAVTYGYLPNDSVVQLIGERDISDKQVFMDMGSGSGRVVLSACMNYPFEKCIGVEFSEHRHNLATKVKDTLADKLGISDRVDLIKNNLLSEDVSFRDVDVAYVSNLCFNNKMIDALSDKIDKQMKPGAAIFASKNLKCDRCKLEKDHTVQQSWFKTGSVKQYTIQ